MLLQRAKDIRSGGPVFTQDVAEQLVEGGGIGQGHPAARGDSVGHVNDGNATQKGVVSRTVQPHLTSIAPPIDRDITELLLDELRRQGMNPVLEPVQRTGGAKGRGAGS